MKSLRDRFSRLENKRNVNRLGSYVTSSVKSLKAGQAIKLHQLKEAWLHAVGPFLGTQTEPVKIKGQTLFLIVSSPMWAQEVNLQQRLILQKLKSKLSKPPRRITCWVGEPHKKRGPKIETAAVEVDELVPWRDIEIPSDRRQRIKETTSSIHDEKLQKKMYKLLELSVQREIYLLEQGQLPCPHCGNFRPPKYQLCADCRREQKVERERKVMRLLAERPWLKADDLAERATIKNRTAFMEIRRKLLANLMLQAWQRTSGMKGAVLRESIDEPLRTLLLDITMLKCSLPAHSLQNQHFYHALGKRLAEAYLNEDDPL